MYCWSSVITIEVERLYKITTFGVTKALKAQFARYRVPDTVVSDNGPQFGSKEFVVFAKTWGFNHVTSSPSYPQSNGKAENAVKTIKRLFIKCRESGESEYLALLDWRNTPSEGLGNSPAQHFLGCRCKTLLPTTTSPLQPAFPTEADVQAHTRQRQRQQVHVKPLNPIPVGETIRLRRQPGAQEHAKALLDQEVMMYKLEKEPIDTPLLTSPSIVDKLTTEQLQSLPILTVQRPHKK